MTYELCEAATEGVKEKLRAHAIATLDLRAYFRLIGL